MGYMAIGLILLSIGKPLGLLKIATNIMNFALGFSCFHTLVINTDAAAQAAAAGLVRAAGAGRRRACSFSRWPRSRPIETLRPYLLGVAVMLWLRIAARDAGCRSRPWPILGGDFSRGELSGPGERPKS